VHRSVPLDLLAKCAAASLVLPEGAAFSGLTAVQLLGLPLPRGAAWQVTSRGVVFDSVSA
jgi:hypothetical protein